MASTKSAAWPMFHQNPQHTGLSPFLGPSVPFVLWKFHTGGIIDSPPAVSNERIYLTSEDGNVYALNKHGILLWRVHTGWPLFSTPATGADGTIYVAGCLQCEQSYPHTTGDPQGVLYALNPGGQLKWNLTLPNAGEGTDILASPTIGTDGTIYTSNKDFQILAVNPNGVIRWELSTGGEVFNSPTIGHDGTLYVGIDDDNSSPSGVCGHCLVALTPDGTLRWNTPFNVAQENGPVGSDGTIYAANYALNPDGSLKWKFNAYTLGLAIGADGTIFFGQAASGSGYIYSLDQNGAVVWKFPIGDTITTCGPTGFCFPVSSISPPSIGADGTLHVGTADGNLYAMS